MKPWQVTEISFNLSNKITKTKIAIKWNKTIYKYFKQVIIK